MASWKNRRQDKSMGQISRGPVEDEDRRVGSEGAVCHGRCSLRDSECRSAGADALQR